MKLAFIIICHVAISLAAPQIPASQYGPPGLSTQEFAPPPLSMQIPQPVPNIKRTSPFPYERRNPFDRHYPYQAPAPAANAPQAGNFEAYIPPSNTLAAPPPQYVFNSPIPQSIENAPAPQSAYSAPAPQSAYSAPAPQSAYSAPAPYPNAASPLTSGGELLSAPAPGAVPEEVVLPQNTRLEIRDDKGQYSHGFSDDKGTQISEQGSLITTNGGWEYVIAKKGSYSYISPEGKTISVSYLADHNGFKILNQKVE
uniref:Cuticle protein n=1 Tax=Clastoptera arizonana TaxID=38151 RepID=A0A1B6EH62_9HEMI